MYSSKIQHILEPNYKTYPLLAEVFKKIADRNTILFLGAGASVGDSKYLSKDLIDYYEEKKGISWNISDLTEFVDTLINDPSCSREEFDNLVDVCLRNYRKTKAHEVLARLNWREIITTNYDLLIENSFEEIKGTPAQNLRLKQIRERKDYGFRPDNDELLYIKLNGCLSDKKKYKLVASTDDFEKAKPFYRVVLNSLKALSDNIQFLSIGYSFSDLLAKQILEKFDAYNYRDKRWIFAVDPFVNTAKLPYYTNKKYAL